MKGSEARLLEYMEGSKKRFVIPVYQRSYDWKLENCKQLFDDLVTVVRTKRTSHFFGSIVSAYQPNGRYTEYGKQAADRMELRNDTFESSLGTMSEKIVTLNRVGNPRVSNPAIRPDADWRIENSTAAPRK